MLKRLLIIATLLVNQNSVAEEEKSMTDKIETLREQGYSVKMITPIYSQLLMRAQPKEFVPAFEKTNSDQYIHESVPKGQSIDNWTEMITITGKKDLARNSHIPPIQFATNIANGFKRDCPNSYSAINLGINNIDGFHAFGAFVACGTALPTGDPFSESALIIAIRGANDYYTIQWAERGPASKGPIEFDAQKWGVRLRKLFPIKLCPVIPGEEAPYPSCVNRQ